MYERALYVAYCDQSLLHEGMVGGATVTVDVLLRLHSITPTLFKTDECCVHPFTRACAVSFLSKLKSFIYSYW